MFRRQRDDWPTVEEDAAELALVAVQMDDARRELLRVLTPLTGTEHHASLLKVLGVVAATQGRLERISFGMTRR